MARLARGVCPFGNRGGMGSYGGRVRSQNGPINRPGRGRATKVVVVKEK